MKKLTACLKALWAMGASVRWRMAVTVAIGVLRIAASLGFVWASKYLVDIATGVTADDIVPAIGLFLGILFVQLGTIILNSWWTAYSHVKAQNHLRKEIFGHIMRSRWDGRERFLSGDAVNRLEEDTRVVAELLMNRLPGMAVTLVGLIASSVYLVVLAPNLLWVLLILMCATVFGSKLFFKQLRRLMAAIRARESELQQLMQESLQHRVLVLTLTNLERVLDKFGWMQEDVEGNTRKRLNYNAVARGLMFFGFQAGHAAAFLWGIFGIIDGTVTYGTMTAFLQLVGRVQRPIAEFGEQIPAFIQAITSIERLMDLLELEQEPLGRKIQLSGAPAITVNHLDYTYPGGLEPIFKDFSCTFPAGEMSVIAGPTGVGKSTLIRLVLGLLKPSAGSVLVDGHPAGSALRSNFMYIPQGNSLLSGTIRSNLQLAAPQATEEEMHQALETAQAGFVFQLPKGLDTPCGEIGSGLSEGQAQRIAIARALLRPGGVMILDESTSALDPETEKQLLDTLHKLYHGRKTLLFISHREATLRYADNVITLSPLA